MHLLENKIREANRDGRIATIPFLTAGFPDLERFWESIRELDEAGADIIEIGVPFSDPVADGPVIENASRRVLEKGLNLKTLLEGLKKRKFRAGLVLMGYMNPFFQYGFEKLANDAKEAGVNGFIIPDLPYEESENIKNIFAKNDLALISLVGPNTDKKRMALYAREAKGYVYVVSVMGITGTRKKISESVSGIIKMAKEIFTVPVALGFGLKTPDQLQDLSVKPDAAVFGSALLTHLDSGKPASEFMQPWLERLNIENV